MQILVQRAQTHAEALHGLEDAQPLLKAEMHPHGQADVREARQRAELDQPGEQRRAPFDQEHVAVANQLCRVGQFHDRFTLRFFISIMSSCMMCRLSSSVFWFFWTASLRAR